MWLCPGYLGNLQVPNVNSWLMMWVWESWRVLMQSPPNFQFSDIEAAGREKQQQNFECDLVDDNIAGFRKSIIRQLDRWRIVLEAKNSWIYKFPEKIGPLNMFNTLGAWKSFLIFIIENYMMSRGELFAPKKWCLCPIKSLKIQNRNWNQKTISVLLSACLSQTTGGAFCLDECPRNVISCNIIWRHPACQIQDIFLHWCEKQQNSILSVSAVKRRTLFRSSNNGIILQNKQCNILQMVLLFL